MRRFHRHVADGDASSMSPRRALGVLRELSRHKSGRLRAMTAFALIWGAASAAEPLVLAQLFDEIARPSSAVLVPVCLAGWLSLALLSAFVVRRCDARCFVCDTGAHA